MACDLTGRQALVTGGTSGIGAAVAKAFSEAGARVLVTGLTLSELDGVTGDSIEAVVLDVADDSAVKRVVESLTRLDVLVNCAGTILRDEQEFDPAKFASVVDVNLNGTMRVCAASRDRLADSHGNIVNVASMLSFFGSGFVPGYSASKGGIAQLTKSLAIAWAAHDIRVNAVAPGWIATAFTQALIDDEDRNRPILARTPMDRWGTPEEVADAITFLASDAARFITGVVLPVDGGYSIA